MSNRTRLMFAVMQALLIVITFVSSIVIVFTAGPTIETRFFPVTSKLLIERMVSDGPDKTNVYAAFEKLRDCEYLGIAWYRGSLDQRGFERVPLILLRQEGDNSSPNRPVGFQRSGPWVVSIPLEEIKTNSFVRLSHKCHPFWVTTTEFYP